MGDSITYGFGIKDRDKMSYPAQLGKLLGTIMMFETLVPMVLTLLSKGNAPYIKIKAYKDALNFEPNIVIIKLGTNDSKAMNWQHKSDFIPDYLKLIESFRNLKSRP